MKKFLTVLLLGSLPAIAAAGDMGVQLLWDNYVTNPPGYDGVNGLASERNSLVPSAIVVDDVIFETEVSITEIRWIAFRDTSPGAGYPGADIFILDGNGGEGDRSLFDAIHVLQNVAFSATVLGSNFGLETYEGSADISSEEIILPAGRYFVGARLVGNQLGRNFGATTGNGALNGLEHAYWQSDSFGQDTFINTDVLPNFTGGTEFAYRVYGTIIPEPLSLLMLAVGGVVFAVRRR